MRIGIDCRLWSETGVGRYTRNLIKQLAELDKHNEYTLFVLSKDHSDVRHSANSKWLIVDINIRWHTLEEQLEFPKVLEKENLDLVHFPYFSVPIFYNKLFIVTIHDLILHHFPTGQASTSPLPVYWLKLQGYRYVIQQAAKKAERVLAVSHATKQEIVDHLHVPGEKVAVTCEAIDEKVGPKTQSKKPQLTVGDFFLYVGNAYPHKNLDRLVEAFKKVQQKNPKLSLVLVGKNDFFYKRLRKARQNDGIIFLENVEDEELAWLYQHAKALVMPSLMEGFGLTTLEAMANNCLVLASDIPSLKEICDNAAVYFDPYSVEDISEKMSDSLSSIDTSKYIKNGLENIRRFSWEKMARETLQVYESCSR